MSQNYDDSKQPKAVIYHPLDFADYLQQQMGIINSHQGFDHFFLQCELVHKLLPQIIEAFQQGVIKNKSELGLNSDSLYKINKIWNGRCYLAIHHNLDGNYKIDEYTFEYSRPTPSKFLTVQKLPALCNMNPVGHIRDKTWGIQIREYVPVRFAFEGVDPHQLTDAGYVFKSGYSLIPRFETQQDIQSSTKLVCVVSRNYFHKVIEIEKKYWEKHWAILAVNTHRIIYGMKLGFKKEERKKRKTEFAEVE